MRKTKIITTKQNKKEYTNKTTKEPMHSQAKKKNKTANMRPKKNGVDHHDSLLVSFVALGTIFFLS